MSKVTSPEQIEENKTIHIGRILQLVHNCLCGWQLFA
jgi:hypothetical protein